MLLITASSALRCSVSFSRRWVSSNSRAFSSARPFDAATVSSRRTSIRRTRAPARDSRAARARAPVAAHHQDADVRLGLVGSFHRAVARSDLLASRVENQGPRRFVCRSASGDGGTPKPLPVLERIDVVEVAGLIVVPADPMSPVPNTSRSLSPTRFTIPVKSSEPAMPCWMLLMTASSATRWRSASKLRAFCSASPRLTATVEIRPTSAALKACSGWLADGDAADGFATGDERHVDERIVDRRSAGARAC